MSAASGSRRATHTASSPICSLGLGIGAMLGQLCTEPTMYCREQMFIVRAENKFLRHRIEPRTRL
jgi:hypothetical protein